MENTNERFTSGLTSEQLKKFGQLCALCGQPYGSHQAATFNCPKVPRDEAEPFVKVSSFLDKNPTPAVVQAADSVRGIVGQVVEFFKTGCRGTVVELVPAGQLPTTKGLRHISDKRRTPKPRSSFSYVVQVGSKATRASLYWPEGDTFKFV
jgi:hypothetical protein